MKIENIEHFNNKKLVQDIAKICGEVTVECADAAGVVSKQLETAEVIHTKQNLMVERSEKLFNDLTAVVHATDDASSLSQNAKKKLDDGTETIENAIRSFHSIVELINSQSHRIASLSDALNQVKSVTSSIDQIAKTTNMLALNATIEAEKAGEAGVTFAVVASEVKKLSNDTRMAADKITKTVNLLSDEAVLFLEDLKGAEKENKGAREQLTDLNILVADVSKIVNEVESKNVNIAQTTGAIYDAENENSEIRKEFLVSNQELHNNLFKVQQQIGGLEKKSNEMFDIFVKSGLSLNDAPYVEKSIENCKRIQRITEAAIDAGELSLDDVFDKNLIKIEGSNPERFRNRLTQWADRNWQPLFDEIVQSSPNIFSFICSSQDGYLPTHVSSMSQQPTGDPAHDIAHCRNGRKFVEPAEYHIKRSNEPYTMAVYRQEGDGHQYLLVRNVYVPLFIKGQRWGDVELGYSCD